MSSILDILYIPMGYIMKFAYKITNNYLLSIMLFALVIEIIMIPIQIKQQKNSIKQAKLQPKVRAITKKYDGRTDRASMQKKQEETMALYQQEGFSQLSGCLPLLIQLPVIWCLYQVIITPLQYIVGFGTEELQNIVNKLSSLGVKISSVGGVQQMQMDVIKALNVPSVRSGLAAEGIDLSDKLIPNFRLGGLDMSVTPNLGKVSWYWIVPLIVLIASYLSMVIIKKFTYQPPEQQQAQNGCSMKVMNIAMPLLSAYISFQVPVSIGCYWIFRNILSVGEKYFVSKKYPIPQATDEEIKEAEKQYAVKEKKEKKPVRSLHSIDFDDEPLPPPVFTEDEDDDDFITKGRAVSADSKNRKNKDEKKSAVDQAPLKEEKEEISEDKEDKED